MNSSIWFISDLHLDQRRPAVSQQFLALLETLKGKALALYILGDLFEYWIGDDILEAAEGQPLQPIVAALRSLSDSGTQLYFIHGNRDFLLGSELASRTGMELLAESVVVDLYGEPTLIMHGDTLCTDDVAYQQARLMLRSEKWQQQALALPIPERIEMAKSLRQQSEASMGSKAEDILDVNSQAVIDTMRQHKVKRMIHGHTHRPAIHDFEIDGDEAQRIVLGDWYDQASHLCVTADEWSLSFAGETHTIAAQSLPSPNIS